MGDLKLFRIDNGAAVELQGTALALERRAPVCRSQIIGGHRSKGGILVFERGCLLRHMNGQVTPGVTNTGDCRCSLTGHDWSPVTAWTVTGLQ